MKHLKSKKKLRLKLKNSHKKGGRRALTRALLICDMIYVVCTVAGFIFGFFLSYIIFITKEADKTFGYIKKADNDDGGIYLFLDLDRFPEEMEDYRDILFKVDFNDSRK